MQTTRSETSRLGRLGERGEVLGRRVVEVDHAVGQSAADRDLVHVDVGRVEEAALLRHRDDGQRVGQPLGGDRGAFQRIERDVDLGPVARRRPSRRYRASAPRRARPRRSPPCPRSRGRSAPGAWRRPRPGRPRFSSPRPISRDAASAAASVTRTASSARLRSMRSTFCCRPCLSLRSSRAIRDKRLDADHPRRLDHRVERGDFCKRAVHGRLLASRG